MFKIDKAIPVPVERIEYTRYPLADLQVGDSFYVPDDGDPDAGHRVRAAAFYFKRRYGREFTVRRSGEGVRVWRLS